MPLPFSLDELNDNPLYRSMGIRITSVADGRVCAQLRPEAAMCWPDEGQPHGGVLFTLLDTTMATVVMTGGYEHASCSTISMDVQYLAPAVSPTFACAATMERRGGRVCFVRGTISDHSGEVVALGQGSFRIFTPR